MFTEDGAINVEGGGGGVPLWVCYLKGYYFSIKGV